MTKLLLICERPHPPLFTQLPLALASRLVTVPGADAALPLLREHLVSAVVVDLPLEPALAALALLRPETTMRHIALLVATPPHAEARKPRCAPVQMSSSLNPWTQSNFRCGCALPRTSVPGARWRKSCCTTSKARFRPSSPRAKSCAMSPEQTSPSG
ncbi:MAG: hypothetical protein HC915_17580 [Anaerolineae bacterium]|nr:hypothetical protein [Anaerolineae bacterium]